MHVKHEMLHLPGYRLRKLIESSAKTQVYRGIRKSDNQKVIIKILTIEYPTPGDLHRYQQEYAIAHKLNAGVVAAYSLEYHQQKPFLVFEDIGGISLKQYVASNPIGLSKFLAIAIQISKSLGEIHSVNIIHKDINPSNIIINPSTGEVRPIDFGIATQLSRENPTLKNPSTLEGTLSYMSPEQTGRMNRLLDYRTDFYSLGVTFYELLAGQLPFHSQDPLELVHCHLAQQPASPQSLHPEIPLTLANIILKLMAKNAEERYQSAWGLVADLQECQQQLEATGSIQPFTLGRWDFSEKFQIPQKLYGREAEIATLLDVFERVSSYDACARAIDPEQPTTQPSELMLINGYSGIGKSALVAEIHQPITAKRGYFITGKFDQLQRHIPYSALVDAFRELIEQLLTESEDKIQHWQQKILAALGDQGQIIIQVIPDLELIIGSQPTVSEVGLTEAQHRFNLLFQKFIRVFCTREHPLVLFLDDLQWSDLATLKLIEVMLNDPETKYLLLIGAYRDTEVNAHHPLVQTINALNNQGVCVNQIHLNPLKLEAVIQLIAETLHQDYTTVTYLAELVLQKTGGNPLFVNQFLTTLYREKLFKFSPPTEDSPNWGWSWNLQEIQATDITDNVVDLLIAHLNKLSKTAQKNLSLAACIGYRFQLETLSVVSQKYTDILSEDLMSAIEDGLIIPEKHFQQNTPIYSYRFAHDRIQQAAYSLIPPPVKHKTHLKIGNLLLKNTSPEKVENNIFEITNHFNISKTLITSERLRVKLAELNLKAGLKAMKATAYSVAVNYLRTGLGLLNSQTCWNTQYDLTRSLYKSSIEAEHLNGDFTEAKRMLDVALTYSRSNVDKAELYKMLIVQRTLAGQYTEAIEIGINALALLNINLRPDNLEARIQEKMAEVQKQLADRSVESLLDLPPISDSEKKIAVQLLISLDPPTYITGSPLYTLISAKAVNLSIQYGNIAESAKAYANYGVLVGAFLGNYQLGYQFGHLAVKLSQKLGSDSQKCQACLLLGSWIAPWCKPIKGLEQINWEGYQSGLKSGEVQFAGYNLFGNISNKLVQGLPLNLLLTDLSQYLSFGSSLKNQLNIDILLAIKKLILPLLGELPGGQKHPDEVSDREFIDRCESSQTLFALTVYYIGQMQVCCFTRKFEQGLHHLQQAEKILDSIFGFTLYSEYYYYASLIILNQPDWYLYLDCLTENQQMISKWAKSCPENFQHKSLLIKAEQCRRNGQILAAMDLYDRAIELAQDNEFIQDQALANELAAYFYLSLGKEQFAKIYLSHAYAGYDRWGAKTKLQDLETKYTQYINQISQNAEVQTTKISSDSGQQHSQTLLDIQAILKFSQKISQELNLSKLLSDLMKIIIEIAGSERGYLLLNSEGDTVKLEDWKIEAIGEVRGDARTSLLNSAKIDKQLPKSILQYVMRTKKLVVYQNASQQLAQTKDAYLQTHQPKSLLCIPLLNQGRIIAVVYLENNLATGVFTSERLECKCCQLKPRFLWKILAFMLL